MSKDSIKNNPHYQNGFFWGRRIIRHVENTVYGTLENGVETKKQLIEDLKVNFGWDETQKDVAEAMGMMDAWQQEIDRIAAETPEPLISIEDIKRVAGDIGITLTEEQLQLCVERYPGYVEQDPLATWDLIVEQVIHDINGEVC